MSENITLCYDGTCKFCQNSVDWVIRHDKHGRITLKPLDDPGESVVLIDGNGTWSESSAVLRTVEHLGGVWRLARLLMYIPRPLRNAVYRMIARRRHRLLTAPEATQNTAG